MPLACTLDSEDNPKDYSNEENKYTKNFFHIYCHCQREYDNFLAPGTFMLQCYSCEDWFHNYHLQPKQVTNIADEAILICRNCC